MVLYILQPRHIFMRVKAVILMLVLGGLKLLILSMCFAWRPVTPIIKSHVLTAHAHENCHINAGLSFHLNMAVNIMGHGYLCSNAESRAVSRIFCRLGISVMGFQS